MADKDVISDLCAFLDASPSPYHAVAEVARRLELAGFTALDEGDAWQDTLGDRYLVRGATVVAWRLSGSDAFEQGFRIIGAHTDSPNLRIKPRPDTGGAGYRQLGVEVYGGALLNSWLDRDLALSGRVAVRGADARSTPTRLVRTQGAVARIPQLAIHLDRQVNEVGLVLNPQQHLVPIWGVGSAEPGDFRRFLALELGVSERQVMGWDVMFHDHTPAAVIGAGDEFISSGRIDNLLSCWAAVTALIAAPGDGSTGVPVICLFDHEEIGSTSASGAASPVLADTLERVALGSGIDRAGYLRTLARSHCASVDGAHATNPNYAERHEPDHRITIDGGPVLKLNANVRYASDAETGARFALACEQAGSPHQPFVVRSDMACGSTIGPITAAALGIATVDCGVAQLAMHSARELCGTTDAERLPQVLSAWLALD